MVIWDPKQRAQRALNLNVSAVVQSFRNLCLVLGHPRLSLHANLETQATPQGSPDLNASDYFLLGHMCSAFNHQRVPEKTETSSPKVQHNHAFWLLWVPTAVPSPHASK